LAANGVFPLKWPDSRLVAPPESVGHVMKRGALTVHSRPCAIIAQMTTPQEEAASILKLLLDGVFSHTLGIKDILRQCAHVCRILGWTQQRTWFQTELEGYPSGSELPPYRKVEGRTRWLATGGHHTVLDKVVDDSFSLAREREEEPTEVVSLDVWAGIDWIISVAEHGYAESTDETSERYISFRHRHIEIEKVRQFDKSVFQATIDRLESLAFDFVSEAYSLLRYGDALHDVWQAYSEEVDGHLTTIGFGAHLDAIRNGLSSANPQDWRTAMWSCRDLLHDLADYLWQDTRDTYDHLPGKDGRLRVTKSDYVNRLSAYLHCKGTTGHAGAYLRAEMERIYGSIDTLNDLDNKAHSGITITDVRTAAIGTYFIIGELVIRTDMQPVRDYSINLASG